MADDLTARESHVPLPPSPMTADVATVWALPWYTAALFVPLSIASLVPHLVTQVTTTAPAHYAPEADESPLGLASGLFVVLGLIAADRVLRTRTREFRWLVGAGVGGLVGGLLLRVADDYYAIAYMKTEMVPAVAGALLMAGTGRALARAAASAEGVWWKLPLIGLLAGTCWAVVTMAIFSVSWGVATVVPWPGPSTPWNPPTPLDWLALGPPGAALGFCIAIGLGRQGQQDRTAT